MDPPLRLRFLGTVQIERDGKSVRGLRSRKALALLGYLAVQEQPTPREQLADLFWENQPESTGRANLSWAMNQLSTLLPDCLQADRHTVQFCRAEHCWLDLDAFRALEAQENVSALVNAVNLYRGEFLEGLSLKGCAEFEIWLTGERERWRERATHALAKLVAQHVQRGEIEPGLTAARRLLTLEPWREETHRQVMQLLAHSGQRSAALAQYETCRRTLREALNVAPMPETTALYERIRAATTPRHNLPAQPTPFVGQQKALATLNALLGDADCRLLTLLGPGGIGKTRLALQAAAAQADAFLEGVYFIPLAGISSPDLLVPTIADALTFSFAGRGAPEPRAQLLNYLRRKEVLLILDSFEHLLESAELLGEVLQHAPEVKLLVTSRARLNLRWERRFTVEGMAYPKEEGTLRGMKDEDSSLTAHPSSCDDYDAVQLFQQTARCADPSFAPSVSEKPAVARICQMVEGMPLAIELAAATVGTHTCAEIASAIERDLAFLKTDLRDMPARHRSVQAAFEQSWRLLNPMEQRAFVALSVFRRGCSPAAARAVTGATPPDLEALVSKSLLRFLPAGRYEMHELLRQYASERLAAQPEMETEARDKHCAHYLALLQKQQDALFGADAAQAQAAIRAEIDNIRAAWDWAVTHARVEELARGLNGLARFHDLVGPYREGEILIKRAVQRVRALAKPDTQVLLSRLLSAQARFQMLRGMGEESLVTTQEALELATRANATGAMALGHLTWGNTLVGKNAYEAAQLQVEQALSLAQSARLRPIEAECLNALGRIAWQLGNFAQATIYFEQAERICDEISSQRGKSTSLMGLGLVYAVQGDYIFARRYIEQALLIYRRIGDRQSESAALDNLGLIANQQGDYAAAQVEYQESLRISRDLGDRYAEGSVTINLGYVSYQEGDYARAEDYYRQSEHIFREIGARQSESLALSCLGLLSHHQGDNETACQYCQRALQIAQEVGARNVQAYALTRLGHALVGLGRLAEAADAYQQALDVRRALGQQNLAIEALAGLARVALAQGNLSQAQTQVEEILQHLETRGVADADQPFRIYLTCYHILRANRDSRAQTILSTAHRLLQEHAARLGDEIARRAFLENVPYHREIAREIQSCNARTRNV